MASKKTKAIIGAATAAAAVAGLIYGAKKLHDKGYDKKAINRLKDYSKKLKVEAERLEKKARKKAKPVKKKARKKAKAVKKAAKK